MQNYIFTDSTIAILKKSKKTIIIDVDKIRVINKNIKKVIEDNCLINGSSYLGRMKYVKKYLNNKYRLPIIINKDIILIQMNSLRNENSVLIVFKSILNYKEHNNSLFIRCKNNYILKENISKNTFEKEIISCVKINNLINSKKNENFV